MRYGYARVSTSGQAKDGNGLEVQRCALLEAGAEEIFSDSFTGTKKHRPELDKLCERLDNGDTLIVTKLDRIARSTRHGIEIIEELLERGVKVHVLNIGIMDDTPNGRLMRTMFFAFAEWERDMIVERTQEGKQVARLKSGYKEGRPEVDVPEFKRYQKKSIVAN